MPRPGRAPRTSCYVTASRERMQAAGCAPVKYLGESDHRDRGWKVAAKSEVVGGEGRPGEG